MELKLKEVYFYQYCKECKHYDVDENEHPCDICIAMPGREFSHRPEFFEKVEKKEK